MAMTPDQKAAAAEARKAKAKAAREAEVARQEAEAAEMLAQAAIRKAQAEEQKAEAEERAVQAAQRAAKAEAENARAAVRAQAKSEREERARTQATERKARQEERAGARAIQAEERKAKLAERKEIMKEWLNSRPGWIGEKAATSWMSLLVIALALLIAFLTKNDFTFSGGTWWSWVLIVGGIITMLVGAFGPDGGRPGLTALGALLFLLPWIMQGHFHSHEIPVRSFIPISRDLIQVDAGGRSYLVPRNKIKERRDIALDENDTDSRAILRFDGCLHKTFTVIEVQPLATGNPESAEVLNRNGHLKEKRLDDTSLIRFIEHNATPDGYNLKGTFDDPETRERNDELRQKALKRALETPETATGLVMREDGTFVDSTNPPSDRGKLWRIGEDKLLHPVVQKPQSVYSSEPYSFGPHSSVDSPLPGEAESAQGINEWPKEGRYEETVTRKVWWGPGASRSTPPSAKPSTKKGGSHTKPCKGKEKPKVKSKPYLEFTAPYGGGWLWKGDRK